MAENEEDKDDIVRAGRKATYADINNNGDEKPNNPKPRGTIHKDF